MKYGLTDNLGHFNPRPREGSDILKNLELIFLLDFNPRPREGSDDKAVETESENSISIHAPVKGAT